MTCDFVIVGGGIGGAVLATLLTRAGQKAIVLEKATGPLPFVRPEVLWPATVATMRTLLGDAFEKEAARPLRGIRVFEGERWLESGMARAIEQTGIQPFFTNPNVTRELLLARGGFELRRGVEVAEILREGGRIAGVRAREIATGAEFEVRAPWTVGDDGVHSLVRQACGIPLITRMFPVEFLCFGAPWPADFPEGQVHLWLNPDRTADGLLACGCGHGPGAQGIGVLIARTERRGGELPELAAYERFLAREPSLRALLGGKKYPDDFARIRRPWGHAPSYGVPGAVLLGDAAHPVSPAGGQGANMFVADAHALAAVASETTGDLLPAAYEQRRRAANQRSFRPTLAAAQLFQAPDWLAPPWLQRLLLRRTFTRPAAAARILRDLSSSFA